MALLIVWVNLQKQFLDAGVKKVLKNNIQDVVSANIRALYGKQKYAYKYSNRINSNVRQFVSPDIKR